MICEPAFQLSAPFCAAHFRLRHSRFPKRRLHCRRMTVTLVQIDAVVTDSGGRHVMDLGPEDFQLFQDQEAKRITFFSRVPGPSRPPHAYDQQDRDPVPIISRPLSGPAHVTRVIGLVVDDLALSFENLVCTRALKRYVETQLQPGNLVGIVRTAAASRSWNSSRPTSGGYAKRRFALVWYLAHTCPANHAG